jgi:branched-chain amino acid transport system ATP-binding protein
MTPVLECTQVTKQFGSLKAVSDVTLSIQKGARHALIGPNGAGKSTFFNMLAGTLAPTSGTIMFDGVDVTRKSAAWRAKAGLAKTFQHSSLFLSLPVADNVAIAAQRKLGQGHSLVRPAHRLAGVDEVVEECLTATGLDGSSRRTVSDLSHGERRQLEVAVALATRPRLLLLDEPTAGMSAAESGRFAAMVESLDPQVTVLIIEHDLDVVFRLAERISVLHLGRLLADDDRESIRNNEEVQRAYLGDARPEDLFYPAVAS